MHGIVRPSSDDMVVGPDRAERVKAKLHEYRFFLLLVILPTLIVAAYYYLVASDQYESEADFIVRSSSSGGSMASGIGSLLSLGSAAATRDDALSVVDYLESTEATMTLEHSIGLTKRFHISDADYVSRLKSATPTPEKLRKYYAKQVKIKYDKDTGISKLTVHAFRPEDAYVIANELLRLGEGRVNQLNDRSNRDALSSANRMLAEAEKELRTNQVQLTAFRRTQADIDPEATGKAQLSMVTGLSGSLTAARAQLAAMRGIIAPSSPQYVAAVARVRALEAEVGREGGRIAGQGAGTVANRMGDYEGLRVRQEFAVKRYELAAGAYQAAREDARKKEIYLVRVVNPNVPVSALFPERARIVLTVFGSLLLAYGIGWLLAAGVREHAAG